MGTLETNMNNISLIVGIRKWYPSFSDEVFCLLQNSSGEQILHTRTALSLVFTLRSSNVFVMCAHMVEGLFVRFKSGDFAYQGTSGNRM